MIARGGHHHLDFDADDILGKAYDAKVMSRLLRYMGHHRVRLAVSMLMMVIVTLTYIASPYLVKLAIDQFIAQGDIRGLDILAALYVLISLVGWAATYGQTYLLTAVSQSILYTLRLHLFQHLQKLSLRFYDNMEVGRIMSRVQNDVAALNEVLTSGLVGTASDLLTLGGIVVIMFSMNLRLSLMTFAVLPLMVIITAFWRVRARDAFRRVRRALALVNASLQENISGVRVIQSFAREAVNLERFAGRNRDHLNANLQSAALSSIFYPAVEIIGALAMAFVIVLGGSQVLSGEMTAGALVAFTLYINRFFDPVRDLSQRYTTMQAAMAAGERIFELLDTEPEIKEDADPIWLPPLQGEIEYDRVRFAYTDGRDVLKDIELLIDPGKTVALVGRTGAGKSSLISLLSRFYDVRGGAIMVDDRDIRRLALPSYRSQIGMVLQEPFLFSGTVKENIRFGHLDATDEQIVAVAKTVGAHDFIMGLEEGYDTEVHERGSKMSMGQRQLISFARALLADPRILILDEATNSVDTQTEMIIQRALKVLTKGRTSIIIAHRLSTVKNADRIVVVDTGRIVETGTHQELLSRRGIYYSLYSLSFAGEQGSKAF